MKNRIRDAARAAREFIEGLCGKTDPTPPRGNLGDLLRDIEPINTPFTDALSRREFGKRKTPPPGHMSPGPGCQCIACRTARADERTRVALAHMDRAAEAETRARNAMHEPNRTHHRNHANRHREMARAAEAEARALAGAGAARERAHEAGDFLSKSYSSERSPILEEMQHEKELSRITPTDLIRINSALQLVAHLGYVYDGGNAWTGPDNRRIFTHE